MGEPGKKPGVGSLPGRDIPVDIQLGDCEVHLWPDGVSISATPPTIEDAEAAVAWAEGRGMTRGSHGAWHDRGPVSPVSLYLVNWEDDSA